MTDPTSPPRVLLFGPRGSGKSWLLGALLQAGETQGAELGAEVIDLTGTLRLARDHIYHGKPYEDTRREIVTSTVRLKPWWVNGRPVMDPLEIELLDCDGRAAEGVLDRPTVLQTPRPSAPVARAVADCDAIILAVDATADDTQWKVGFKQFKQFLDAIESGKEKAREVGGFPVFLTLTRCDFLAGDGDNSAAWQRKVTRRCDHLRKAFASFVETDSPELGIPYLPFGSIDLEVCAVAIRRPKLSDLPNPGDLPYGVALLFKKCFAAAKDHRDRTNRSDRLLALLVRAVGAGLLLLLVGVIAVALNEPAPSLPDLAYRIEAYERQDPAPAAVRLAGKNLVRSKRTLQAFRKDPTFNELPAELQEYVNRRLKEVLDYEAFRARLETMPAPAEARSRDDLDRIAARLTGDLRLPGDYSWGDTEAARLRDKFATDVELIRDAETRWHDWYRDLIRQATNLTLTASFAGNWRTEVGSLFAVAGRPPFPADQPIPGSETLPGPRGGPVLYRIPYEFDRVYQARQDWEATAARLAHLTELTEALGLTRSPTGAEPPLDLPEPGHGVDSRTLPAQRWQALRKWYPEPSGTYAQWDLRNFPEPGRSELDRRLERSVTNGVQHVKGLIGRPRDDVQGWKGVAKSLEQEPFTDWGKLLHLLLRLMNARAENPVTELSAFLRRDRFEIELKAFNLLVPDDFREGKVAVAGPMQVTVTQAGSQPRVLTFASGVEAARAGDDRLFRFSLPAAQRLDYRPGDGLTLEVPMRVGEKEFKLIWDEGGTTTYQFDRFFKNPRLVQPGVPDERVPGIRLAAGDGSILPALPILMPDANGR